MTIEGRNLGRHPNSFVTLGTNSSCNMTTYASIDSKLSVTFKPSVSRVYVRAVGSNGIAVCWLQQTRSPAECRPVMEQTFP